MKKQAQQKILKLIAQRNKLRDRKEAMEFISAKKWTDKIELEWLILKDELNDTEIALRNAVATRETL